MARQSAPIPVLLGSMPTPLASSAYSATLTVRPVWTVPRNAHPAASQTLGRKSSFRLADVFRTVFPTSTKRLMTTLVPSVQTDVRRALSLDSQTAKVA